MAMEPCVICGGKAACPTKSLLWGKYVNPEAVGLPAEWKPPGSRYFWRRVEWQIHPANIGLPKGVSYTLVGRSAADRLAAHGIRTFWVKMCTYLVLVRTG